MTWKNITISKYMALIQVNNAQFDDEQDMMTSILSVLHDVDKKYFETIPLKELKALIKEATFVFNKPATSGIPTTLKVGGKKYNIELDLSKGISGQYIDLNTYCKDQDTINQNYHNIIALFLSPRNFFGRDKFARMVAKAKTKEELIVVHERILAERMKIAAELKDTLTMDVVFALSRYFFLLYTNLMKSTEGFLDKEMKKLRKISNQLAQEMNF